MSRISASLRGLAAASLPLLWTATAGANPTAIPVDDPAVCAACHQAVVSEWTESMHAHAHADEDPLFAAMRDLRMKKQGSAVGDKCNQCHTPRSVAEPDAPAGKVGVGCATCHLAASVATDGPSKGAANITFATDGVFRGPHNLPAGASPVHGTGPAAAHIADGQSICMACHGEVANSAGAPTCTTGAELDSEGASCASCHMPMVDGPSGATAGGRTEHRSHAFVGPHRAWLQDDPSFLASAVEVSGRIDGSSAIVHLVNRSGHAFPTGFPGRTVVVKAVGLDPSGAKVWESFTDNPMKQSPHAVLGKVYVDADGKPILPPFAEKLAKDTRLTASEARDIRFDLPDNVHTVKVTVVFALLPGPAAEPLGVTELPEAKPKPIHTLTLKR